MPFTPATTCDVTIDVSHHQGNIDWAAVKQTGIQCVMIKATQRVTKDSRWEINRDGARQHGLLVIPYMFLTTAVTAAEQARFLYPDRGARCRDAGRARLGGQQRARRRLC